MVDAVFEHPRLVGVYDALDPDRGDLELYATLLEDSGARTVLDVGCGTGTFAVVLAARGLEVVGVDPAEASLAVARGKPGADRVRWIGGDATSLPPLQVDAATMTANVAQAIADPADWDGTLRGVHAALRPGGRLFFETRDPGDRAWEHWHRAATHRVSEVEGAGRIETWTEVIDVSGPLVSFRTTWVFHSDGEVLTSHSTLRFREQEEVVASLRAHGYVVDEIRAAPDRFGRELVFLARKPSTQRAGCLEAAGAGSQPDTAAEVRARPAGPIADCRSRDPGGADSSRSTSARHAGRRVDAPSAGLTIRP